MAEPAPWAWFYKRTVCMVVTIILAVYAMHTEVHVHHLQAVLMRAKEQQHNLETQLANATRREVRPGHFHLRFARGRRFLTTGCDGERLLQVPLAFLQLAVFKEDQLLASGFRLRSERRCIKNL